MKTQFRRIIDHVYEVEALVIWSCAKDHVQEIAEHVSQIKDEIDLMPGDGGGTFKCTAKDNTSVYVIWMDKRTVSNVVHEVTHLVSYVFKERGICYTVTNDEQIAYYQAWWCHEIMKPIQRKKKG